MDHLSNLKKRKSKRCKDQENTKKKATRRSKNKTSNHQHIRTDESKDPKKPTRKNEKQKTSRRPGKRGSDYQRVPDLLPHTNEKLQNHPTKITRRPKLDPAELVKGLDKKVDENMRRR